MIATLTLVLDALRALREAAYMFYETFWPLVLGFGLSGVVQAVVRRDTLQRQLGSRRPGALARAAGFGVVSSSCSYAASAMAKSLFMKGADFVATLVFMIASTNLVVELGVVLVVLLGWQFALSEFVGGAIMIVLVALLSALWLRGRVTAEARRHLAQATTATHPGDDADADGSETNAPRSLRSRATWADAAHYALSDLTMLRRELVIGYLVAGALAVAVPAHLWSLLFWRGHGVGTLLENVLVGPLIAILSFVCSIGNVPLAAALWHGGISFGGVVSFIFADLITMPLLLIYRRYYGTRVVARLLLVMWSSMSLAGLATELLFRGAHLVPTRHVGALARTSWSWNYTADLNLVFLVVAAALYYAARHQRAWGGGAGYALDPVCGMQVEVAHAPARVVTSGRSTYFCSDHCATRFRADPARFTRERAHDDDSGDGSSDHDTATDPVCGMSVTPLSAAATREYQGATYYFCAIGCAERFELDPRRYLEGGPVAMDAEGPVSIRLGRKPSTAAAILDPVCGMSVTPLSAAATREYQGATYYFCATSCAERFEQRPRDFLT